ncbi:MAG: apolipoprotein N-acyltransferase, partial [Erythrobacter sp.]|nr:apolipoprotein N-acyltransferase [Erythrobacter sp.]
MDRISAFSLRHPYWTALLLGLVSATGFQPLHLWPLALAAISALVWLLSKQKGKGSAFLVGWLFGVAHFTLTNNW